MFFPQPGACSLHQLDPLISGLQQNSILMLGCGLFGFVFNSIEMES